MSKASDLLEMLKKNEQDDKSEPVQCVDGECECEYRKNNECSVMDKFKECKEALGTKKSLPWKTQKVKK